MKVRILGDVLTITADINFEQLKKATMSKPIVITEDNAPVYAVETNNVGSISSVGTVFTYANTEGKASVNLPIAMGATKEAIVTALGDELANLKKYEPIIVTALEEAAKRSADIAELIEEA